MRNHKFQASKVLSRHSLHGISKQEAKAKGLVNSIGTERSFKQCYANYLRWCDFNGIPRDSHANKNHLCAYQEERSEYVKQKTLNQERQALQTVFKQALPYVKAQTQTIFSKRSYLLYDVQCLLSHQTNRNRITTWLAFYSGLRAHEAATILRIEERAPSSHRIWDEARFIGLDSYKRYTVKGKGGLVREVAVPDWLARLLENRRRETPVTVVDRGIKYLSAYDIGFGQAWSQSFTYASKKALGYSRGGHGLRHSFAKWRLNQLLESLPEPSPMTEHVPLAERALLLVSQLLGHFRLDIVFTYLR